MIELKDIVVKFGDFEALHNINVNVKEGEFFTFLGPSGCGKTTTLRTITGFIEPVSGTVSVNEQDILPMCRLKSATSALYSRATRCSRR